MTAFNDFLQSLDDYVWGIPLIAAILFVGIFFTFRVKFIQIFHLPRAFYFIFKNEKGADGGEISSFAALCTALSATIGTGNIVGVATAVGILAGGPGALLWMWIAALFGMATKYAECFLAVKYRKIDKDGHILGGPFYYIEYGMGKKWKWLAKVFAFFGACVGLFGIGTFSQINGITTAFQNYFDENKTNTISLFGKEYTVAVVLSGAIITVCAGLVIVGGIKRISGVSQVVVPFMAILYVVSAVSLIVLNINKLPGAVSLIFKDAFNMKAVAGGTIPMMFLAMQKGVARGIFSNEAGLGSAPIAAAAAQTKEPVRQGLVSMMEKTGVKACGVSGKDGTILRVDRKRPNGADIGFVGEIKEVNTSLLTTLLDNDFVPVVCPVGSDDGYYSHNINADDAACAIAKAMKAQKLVFLSDIQGVYQDPDDSSSLISAMTVAEARAFLESGHAGGGMLPKIQSCIDAIEGGVSRVHILDGRIPHSLLLEFYTNKGIGTAIMGD
jgi:amino acid carrier protein